MIKKVTATAAAKEIKPTRHAMGGAGKIIAMRTNPAQQSFHDGHRFSDPSAHFFICKMVVRNSYTIWDDLIRWKEGQKLVQDFRGMYFPGVGEYDLEGDGDTDVIIFSGETGEKQNGTLYLKLGDDVVLDENGLINPHPSIIDRQFDENKDYLYPLPRTEILLNPNLEQNPGW